jgi:hypothetical protein
VALPLPPLPLRSLPLPPLPLRSLPLPPLPLRSLPLLVHVLPLASAIGAACNSFFQTQSSWCLKRGLGSPTQGRAFLSLLTAQRDVQRNSTPDF